MARLFTNNAKSTLAGSLTNVATTFSVGAGHGARFPVITGTNHFLVTLYQFDSTGEINHEIVKVTARAVDAFTVERAQEGTTARAFNAADPVELRLTADTMGDLIMAGILASPTSLVHGTATIALPTLSNASSTLSGAMTADTYKDIISVTGSGVLNIAAVRPADNTARTVTLSVMVDGVEIWNQAQATSSSSTTLLGVGEYAGLDGGSIPFVTGEMIPFNESMKIRVKSTITESDKLTVFYKYRLN